VKISIPSTVWARREVIEAGPLPSTWLAEPPGSATIALGDQWLTAKNAPLLLVPSIIVPEECNVLINPLHPLAAKITAQVTRQFVYDPRL
jgi:RES domain-containing protein